VAHQGLSSLWRRQGDLEPQVLHSEATPNRCMLHLCCMPGVRCICVVCQVYAVGYGAGVGSNETLSRRLCTLRRMQDATDGRACCWLLTVYKAKRSACNVQRTAWRRHSFRSQSACDEWWHLNIGLSAPRASLGAHGQMRRTTKLWRAAARGSQGRSAVRMWSVASCIYCMRHAVRCIRVRISYAAECAQPIGVWSSRVLSGRCAPVRSPVLPHEQRWRKDVA
jgi:hypothetical protein